MDHRVLRVVERGKVARSAAVPGPQTDARHKSKVQSRLLVLDSVQYPVIMGNDVPVGFCEVDVKMDDNGEKFECMMVSGHVAGLVEGKAKDTLRPLPSWFMFVKEEL
jgi:hypothetical protein